MRCDHYCLALGILLLALESCSGSSSAPAPTQTPSPPPALLAGNYQGANADSIHGHGAVSANIVQAGSSLAGGWSFSYPGNPSIVASFRGSVKGAAVDLTVPSQPGTPCSYSVSGTANGKQISGSYSSANCGNSGTFTITRP